MKILINLGFIIFCFASTVNQAMSFGFSDLDPFNKNSAIRKGSKELDPTNRHSGVRKLGRDIDRERINLMHLGGQGCRAKANDVMSRFRSNRGLTALEKKFLAPWFGKQINLNKVTVYWGANLNSEMKVGGKTIWVASAAQTFGYRVFFRERHHSGDTQQLLSLAHELVHTVQHERLGGLTRFCQKYMDGYVNAGMDYSSNPMEEEAFDLEFRFAQSLQNEASTTGKIVEIQHGMPNNYRTVWVPERLRLAPQQRQQIIQKTNGYPSGYSMQQCGCWQNPNPVTNASEPKCQSRYVRLSLCSGSCRDGGRPYGYACQ